MEILANADGAYVFVMLCIRVLIIWWGVNLAITRNRGPVLWGILTFLFGLFAIILLFIMGTAKKEETHGIQ